jgi:hypothetical protein
LNPHVPHGTGDFRTTTAFAARFGRPWRFVVWTIPWPWVPAVGRCRLVSTLSLSSPVIIGFRQLSGHTGSSGLKMVLTSRMLSRTDNDSRRARLARCYLAAAGASPNLTASHGEFPTPWLKFRIKSPVSTIPPLTLPERYVVPRLIVGHNSTYFRRHQFGSFRQLEGWQRQTRSDFVELTNHVHEFLHLLGPQTLNELANHFEVFEFQTSCLALSAT